MSEVALQIAQFRTVTMARSARSAPVARVIPVARGMASGDGDVDGRASMPEYACLLDRPVVTDTWDVQGQDWTVTVRMVVSVRGLARSVQSGRVPAAALEIARQKAMRDLSELSPRHGDVFVHVCTGSLDDRTYRMEQGAFAGPTHATERREGNVWPPLSGASGVSGMGRHVERLRLAGLPDQAIESCLHVSLGTASAGRVARLRVSNVACKRKRVRSDDILWRALSGEAHVSIAAAHGISRKRVEELLCGHVMLRRWLRKGLPLLAVARRLHVRPSRLQVG